MTKTIKNKRKEEGRRRRWKRRRKYKNIVRVSSVGCVREELWCVISPSIHD